MRELSIFIDESGDFGPYESHASFYVPSREREDHPAEVPRYGDAVTMTAEEFLDRAMTLPGDARLRLAIRLIESLEVADDSRPAAEPE
ncbi:MAG TPA: hypothetical protein PK324_12635 [Nocardioides sp.]|nr:hypothetical protein [Nocardioides sp.]